MTTDGAKPIPTPPAEGYRALSRRPLQSLVFLLPLILLYEFGTFAYVGRFDPTDSPFIFARSLLADFFKLFGVVGYFLPGVIVVVVLTSLHLTHRDPWRADLRMCLVMWGESLVLALPLFLPMLLALHFGYLSAAGNPVAALAEHAAVNSGAAMQAPAPADHVVWYTELLLAIGAGIYEELLFRLIGIALLHLLLRNMLGLPPKWSVALAVFISAVAFSVYHFGGGGQNIFTWRKCFFYIFAGLYFAWVYVRRGFGIVAGTHAMYDVMVLVLRVTQSE